MPGEESQAKERRQRQGGNQDPATRKEGTSAVGGRGPGGKNKGGKHTGGWRDRGGGVHSSGGQLAAQHTHQLACGWARRTAAFSFSPSRPGPRPLPDTCEAAQKCAPA